MAGKRTNPIDRFWPKVDKSPVSGCWEWTAFIGQGGYGLFSVGGKPSTWIMAHRFSYQLHHGHLPPRGIYVCHKCDNRKCVNPEHLFLGTPADNARDKNKKGRGNYSSHNAKLSHDQVREVFILFEQGVSKNEIARRFNVSRAVPPAILQGRTYRYVPRQVELQTISSKTQATMNRLNAEWNEKYRNPKWPNNPIIERKADA